MLEKDIEEKVCDYAVGKGWDQRKYSSPGHRASPDRIFFAPSGQIIFIEFKRTGVKPTKPQLREHARLRKMKQIVLVVDNVETGKRIIDSLR